MAEGLVNMHITPPPSKKKKNPTKQTNTKNKIKKKIYDKEWTLKLQIRLGIVLFCKNIFVILNRTPPLKKITQKPQNLIEIYILIKIRLLSQS